MGSDDANEGDAPGECVEHMWRIADFNTVQRAGIESVGFGITNKCALCGAIWHEPSNFDKFPDTNGLDPKLYPAEVRRLRERRGW